MNKITQIILLLLLLVTSVGCQKTQSYMQENSSNSQFPRNSNKIETSDDVLDNYEFEKIVEEVIEQYKNNSIIYNEIFEEKPEAFIFPETTPELEFVQNEMGYFTTKILSDDGQFEMYFSINNSTYEATNSENNIYIIKVMFNKIN